MINWFKKLRGKKQAVLQPEFWQRYQEAAKSRAAANTPLAAIDFVVFDTETTGFDKNKDRIVSIGAVRVREGQLLVSESFEWLVQQDVAPGNKSAEIHGILPSQMREGMQEQEAISNFLDFIGGAVLVGHHVGFDIGMLKQLMKRCNLPARLHNQMLDTAQLAIRLEHPLKTAESYRRSDYSLDSLSQRYHLPLKDRHTASGDAFATALLLLKLLAKARQRGVTTLGELL